MNIKFKCKSGRFSDDSYIGYLGANLRLTYADIDGDNQPYSLDYVKRGVKNKPAGYLSENIFDVDSFFGGSNEARNRVIYLTKCLYHGIEPILTSWEQKHLKWGNRKLAVKQTTSYLLHDIFVHGSYYSAKYDLFVEVLYITNAVPKINKLIDEVRGVPSVVFVDIFNNHIYSRNVSDFKSLGFTLMENL